jgi:serine protease Do
MVNNKQNKTQLNKPKVDRVKTASLGLIIIFSISSGFLGGWFGSRTYQQNNGISPLNTNTQVVLNESQLINEVATSTSESVVSINVTTQASTGSFFDSYYYGGAYETKGAGTGIIISEDGYILTNRHVVPAGTKKLSISLSDGTKLDDVEVVGRTGESDPLDIAFLKINNLKGKAIKPAKIGDSSKVRVGDKVIAIGNALGLFQNSVTSGIISGFGRTVQASEDGFTADTLQNLFQTDAAINQGNSGGPLVNINGEVIGINTAIAGGDAQNIGFAIPVNDVKSLIKSVLEKGILERPYLGVRYVPLTDDYSAQFNLPVNRGAYILPSARGSNSILENSPAQKAGLKEKDIITEVDETLVDENNSLLSLIGRKSVGETVELTVLRSGEELRIKATLEAIPQ